ncbi:hypothetical protein J0910_05635 [Nocardiopsis sp. CNT-189]
MQLFKDCPAFAPQLLSECLGVELPEFDQAVLQCADLGEVVPVERRADAVVGLLDTALIARIEKHDKTEMLIVVEVQNEFVEEKVYRWAEYCGVSADRSRCPVALLVLCPDQDDADRYDRWFELGPGFRLKPQVLGPDRLPVMASPEDVARSPELAVLAFAAHPEAPGAVKTLVEGLERIDPHDAAKYTEYTLTLLDGKVRDELEETATMSPVRYRSEYTDRFVEEGQEKGLREGLFLVLESRGIALSAEDRRRIEACRDQGEIKRWYARALAASTAEELFRD